MFCARFLSTYCLLARRANLSNPLLVDVRNQQASARGREGKRKAKQRVGSLDDEPIDRCRRCWLLGGRLSYRVANCRCTQKPVKWYVMVQQPPAGRTSKFHGPRHFPPRPASLVEKEREHR